MSALELAVIAIGITIVGFGGLVGLAVFTGAPRPERDARRRRAF
jgi:hypothetical protein